MFASPRSHWPISLAPICLTLVASVALGGCMLPPPAAPVAKYYVASVASSSSEVTVTTEDGLKVLDPRAADALRPGLTVAFFPPDYCRSDLAAAATTATPESVEMTNECGVMISALETSVADRYSVISWQTLKGTDPFERAAARKVDIIFEVDSMGDNQIGQDASSELRLDFYEQTNASDRGRLVLGAEELPIVASRCKAGVEQLQLDQRAAMTGSFTGAIKAVEVSTGQALVYYQRTLTDDAGSDDEQGFDLYFETKPVADPSAPVGSARYNPLQRGGGAMTGAGVAMVLIGGLVRGLVYTGTIEAADKNRQPGTAISAGVLLAGVFVLAGGITMISIGNVKAKRNPAQPLPYQPPLDVLCVQPVTPPWLSTWTGPAPEGGSSYSFSETQKAGRDAARERQNRLRKLLIDDFTNELGKLSAGG